MTFENISKRRLSFAPKHVLVRECQDEFRAALHEIDFSHTERISANGKMVRILSEGSSGTFEKLPELAVVEGSLSLCESVTLLAAKLTRIDGDLHVEAGAKFYAPLLQEVTGFIQLGNNAVVNAPKIEHLLANDDNSKIKEQTATDWLSTL